MIRTSIRVFPVVLVLLSACGGGGSGGGSNTPAVAPTTLTYSSNEVIGISHVALPTVTAAHDGSPVHFTVTPELPAGLEIDEDTGAISGTPTAPAARVLYDVEVSNSAGSVHAEIALRIVAPARFVVSTSSTDNSFSFLAADTSSGETRRLGQVITDATESGPEMFVVHPNGRFAYAPNLATSNVSVFTVDPTSGWPDLRAPVACGTGPHSVAIDPSGRFAYVANQGSNDLNSYAINSTNGDLTPIAGPLAVGSEPAALVVDPTGKFLFVAMHGTSPIGMGSEIKGFTIDSTSGILTPIAGSLALQGTRPTALCIDTVRPVLFATLETIQRVLPIHFDPVTGVLTPGTIVAAGANPVSVAISETGQYVYVANKGGNTVSAYAVDPVTSQLTAINTYAAGTAPTRVKVDPTSAYVFVSAQGSADIFTFPVDSVTGALSARTSMVVRGSPVDVSIVSGDRPTKTVPRFAHAAAAFSGDVTSYSINPTTGDLTQTGVVPTGNMPSAIAIDPRRRFAWVANSFGSTISIFTMNATTGTLSSTLPVVNVTGKPTHLFVDPSARFLYVTTHDVLQLDDGWLTTYAIDELTGAITPLDTKQIGSNPTSVGIEPTGQFLYTANNGIGMPGTSGISVFSLDPATGIPTNSAPPATAPGVFDLAFHPNGRHLYSVLKGANAIARYSISYATGQLTAVPPPTSAGIDSVGLTITNNGKFAYSCALDSLGTGSFSAHAISADGTIGEPMQTLSDGLHPYDITTDASCKFVYAANSGSNSVTVARIDPVTGMLTLGVPVASGQGVGAIVVTSVTQ